jgi:hypothetical protein
MTIFFLRLYLPVNKPERVLSPNFNVCAIYVIRGTYDVSREVSKANKAFDHSKEEENTGNWTHIVRQMLISRSQLQPVMNPAAAGGKRIATYIQACADNMSWLAHTITTQV